MRMTKIKGKSEARITNLHGSLYVYDVVPVLDIPGYGKLCCLEWKGYTHGFAIVTDDGREFTPNDWLAKMPACIEDIGKLKWVTSDGHIAYMTDGLPTYPSKFPASPRLAWVMDCSAMDIEIPETYARGVSRKAVARRILRLARKIGLRARLWDCLYDIFIPIYSNRDVHRVEVLRSFIQGKSLARTARNNYGRDGK